MNFKAIAVLGAAFFVLVIVVSAYAQGQSAGREAARIDYEARMAAQEAANRKAVDIANRDLMRTADALSAKSQELDNVLQTIDQAAFADPDGGAMCLSADSVRRLNAIR